MSEYFRIVRGLEINEAARILQGAGAPGTTPDTDNAQVGSLYLNTSGGTIWSKVAAGAGTNKWNTSSGQILYTENPVIPPLPAALGDNSVAIGPGALTAADATNSIALGGHSFARHYGAHVVANGRFGSSGDAQHGTYLLRTHTVNGTATEAFLDGTGGTQRLVLPDDATWTFTVTVTGHRTDSGDGHAGYKMEGVIYRRAGAATVAFQGFPVKIVLGESNPTWDINIIADTITGCLKVTMTGQAGKTIRWVAVVHTLEVTN